MRPIDADALPIKADANFVWVQRYSWDNAPTLDVRPVVHAHWIKGGEAFVGVHKVDEYICSMCNYYTLEAGNYCGNCGAVMDEEDNNETN